MLRLPWVRSCQCPQAGICELQVEISCDAPCGASACRVAASNAKGRFVHAARSDKRETVALALGGEVMRPGTVRADKLLC